MLHNWLAWSVNPRKPSKDYSVNWRMRACFRAESGKLGGNPDLLKQKPGKEDNLLKQKDKHKSTKATEDDQAKANQSFKQKPTPSSSSSSSSSTSVNSLKAPNGALRERACASRAALCELK